MTRIETRPVLVSLGSWGLLALPPIRHLMEASMPLHVLQLGLLAVCGGWLAHGLRHVELPGLDGINRHGITGALTGLVTLAFWLLPLSLDRALSESLWALGKFLAVPLLLGFCLVRSWPRLPVVVRGALWAQSISMAIVMGWLYRESPVRLCNNYLLHEQQQLGLLLWLLAAALSVRLIIWAFKGREVSACR